jgi:Spy/CpxP family protein refolding chaperone
MVCFMVCLLMATAVFAQNEGRGRRGRGGFGGPGGPMGMFGRGGGSMMLLGAEPVQKELKLTDDQKDKIDQLRQEMRDQIGRGGGGGGFGNFRDMSDEERQKMFEDMRKRMEERNAESEKKVAEILDAGQSKRLKEIGLWQRGGGALADETVAKELNLSDDQNEQVKTIQEAIGERMQENFQNAQGDFEKLREENAKVMKDAEEEYLAVLTEEQKAKFEAMKGPKPDIDFAALMRPGRGGFGGFGGQGPGRRQGGGDRPRRQRGGNDN